jgi:hypothetical protein
MYVSPVKTGPITSHKEMTANQITDLLYQMTHLATCAKEGARQTSQKQVVCPGMTISKNMVTIRRRRS